MKRDSKKPAIGFLIAAVWLALAAGPASVRGEASELFFSEYVEGSGNNKAIEIYNGTAVAVDLAAGRYRIESSFNGGTSTSTIALTGLIAAGDVYVVVPENATDTTLVVEADQRQGTSWFNGDDAVVLLKGDLVVDSIGQVGFDPGVEWASGLTSTQDNTLRRKAGISAGDNNASDAFDPSVQWDGFDNNTFDDLGRHAGDTVVAPPETCGDPFTSIPTIQGRGTASLLDGSKVVTEGIVTADFQKSHEKKGFFLQDAVGDGDAATSDGIFVYAAGVDVNVGDAVRVRGTVDEYYNLTELTSVSAISRCSTENYVNATPLALPVASLDEFEAYEGMLVTFSQPLYVCDYFDFDRYGEIVLAADRQYQPTSIFDPGSPQAAQLTQENRLGRITLDDGRGTQNPDPARHPNGGVFDLSNLFRGGDKLQNVTGVLDFSHQLYRIQPTQGADYLIGNPRPARPEDVGGRLKVASFNVLNYFTTLDLRGANTAEELTRQRAKTVAALQAIDADVVGLIEIENNSEATANLVEGLNAVVGAGTYAYVDTGRIGTDEIKVALIYKPARVLPVGGYAILDSLVDGRFIDTLNRPSLAQTFQDNAASGVFTVVVNHLKSKGSDCLDVGDPDLGDGAGNCNLTRKAAVEALVDWLASDPTGSGDDDFLIIGDMNSYAKEDPIAAFTAGGYTDLVARYQGQQAYSYLFDGHLGYLDHALSSPGLLTEVTGATDWHINADEPDLIDYDMTYKQDAQDAIYAPDAYRASDHDPVLIGLQVCDEIAPMLSVSVSPTRLWPPNHQYVDVSATVVASDNLDANPAAKLLSVTSSEADSGLGYADRPGDIVIVDDMNFRLRAERSNKGLGRVYTITYQVSDTSDNIAIASATVSVPRRYSME